MGRDFPSFPHAISQNATCGAYNHVCVCVDRERDQRPELLRPFGRSHGRHTYKRQRPAPRRHAWLLLCSLLSALVFHSIHQFTTPATTSSNRSRPGAVSPLVAVAFFIPHLRPPQRRSPPRRPVSTAQTTDCTSR